MSASGTNWKCQNASTMSAFWGNPDGIGSLPALPLEPERPCCSLDHLVGPAKQWQRHRGSQSKAGGVVDTFHLDLAPIWITFLPREYDRTEIKIIVLISIPLDEC